MSQPAAITSDRSWDDLLRMIEDLVGAATRTYDDIRAFHERERPMPEPDADNDIRPVRLTVFDTGEPAEPRDADSRRVSDEQELQDDERQRQQDEMQARQDDLDLEL